MIRVVITGFGAVTPLGNTFCDSWTAVKAGRSGIGPITKFDVSLLPWKVAGEVRNFDAATILHRKEMRRLDPFIHYAVSAAVEAIEDAGLRQAQTRGATRGDDPSLAGDYLGSGGVIIGSSRGGISTLERAVADRQKALPGVRSARPSAYLMPATTIGMASSYVAQKLGIKGYALGISNACASGTNAVGEAYRLIKAGFRGPVIAGGAEAPLCRLCLEGYGVSGVLSKTEDSSASRPFDRSRNGFVLSEGACVMVLEELDHARKRGARVYGEIKGYANTVDAFHQTRPGAEGEVNGIRSAIADAGIAPGDVDYVSTHGTSTRVGDRVEAEALGKVFGENVQVIPVTAIKSATGHMLAASGALEAAFAVMSIREKIIPPTIHIGEKDDDCALRVMTEKTDAEIGVAISNSFGFGGVNAVLVLTAV
jgi:3-oxoacyl-[acyl-carrier-protein] synthase II